MRDILFETTSGHTLDKLRGRKLLPVTAVPTPFPSWNSLCGEEGGKMGLAPRWMIVLGGVTGTGKSYLALNLAANAVMQGELVGLINFEMTQMSVVTRYLSILTGIAKHKLDMGDSFDLAAWERAQEIADQLFKSRGGAMLTNESAIFNLGHVEESYRKLSDLGVKLIIVDYAQLVMVPNTHGIFARSEAVAIRLRELTHEYDVITIAVSQFNREEARRGKPPSIHGLMGGGIWEHAANQIWLLNHTIRERYGKDTAPRYGYHKGEYTELLCGKNRHGIAPFELPLKWDYSTMRFEEYVPGTDPDDPFFDGDVHTVDTNVQVSGPSDEPPVTAPGLDFFGEEGG